MKYDLVIANGLLVTPQGTFTGHLGISQGRIVAISQEPLQGEEVLDARGDVVLPGAVDLHVHFNDPGRADWEGWGPGSRAAAAGGVTTVVEMPLNSLPPVTTAVALEAKVQAARGASVVDFALWGGLITDNLADLSALSQAGAIGFKAFMCETGTPEFTYADDGILYEGFMRLAKLGRLVAVHAENQPITYERSLRLRRAGRRDRRAWGEGRPPIAEWEAIHRALFLAGRARCRLHVVHLSLPEGASLITEARKAGQAVSVETCAHYLTLTEDDFVRLGPMAKCAPPLRDAGRREALWGALLRGEIDCITSDHSPCLPEAKTRGEDDIWEAWGGINGVQTSFPIMLTEGVHKRGLTLERFATLMAANPAKIAGLWPRKGAIQIHGDADLLIIDIDREWSVDRTRLYSRHPHSPFVGVPVTGWIRSVLLRGQPIVHDGEVSAEATGQWLQRMDDETERRP